MAGERIIEMTWHCATCQHLNRGRDKICQGCGKPKGDEEFEMPSNTEAAPTVTDEALLRMASAGPDWQCAYCGSNQRALDGSCGNCGASATAGIREALAAELAETTVKPRRWVPWAIAGGVVAVVAVVAIIAWPAKPQRATAMVTAVAWEQSIQVERYANHTHEGFVGEVPAGATDIVSLGQKVHHTVQVFDHMETEHYEESVTDYHTEHYTEQVNCGEDCTSSSPVCHEECTSKKNGFASCRQVCSGGGRHCTPKYCTRSGTRQVPSSHMEPRTREVRKYRAEPIYAEAVRYSLWDWAHDRTETARGTSVTTLQWPAQGARDTGLPEGERERETRVATYVVTLASGKRTLRFRVATPTVLLRFLPGTFHELDAGQGLEEGRLLIDHEPFAILPEQP